MLTGFERNRGAEVYEGKVAGNKGGFTLVELLIVLALIGVIVAIIAPGVSSRLAHQSLIRGARDIMTELNGARIKAITTNQQQKIRFTMNAAPTVDTYRIWYYNTATSSWAIDTTRAPRSIPDGVDIITPSGDFEIIYQPNGTATTTNICLANMSSQADRMGVTFEGLFGKILIVSNC